MDAATSVREVAMLPMSSGNTNYAEVLFDKVEIFGPQLLLLETNFNRLVLA